MTIQSQQAIVWGFRKSPTLSYAEISGVSDYLLCVALDDKGDHPPLIAIKTGEITDLNGITHPIFESGHMLARKSSTNGFSDTNIFQLTPYGEDILFQLKKDKYSLQLLRTSVIVSVLSLIATLISLWR